MIFTDVVAQRFWQKVDRSGDCWLWTASVTHNGYGQFTVGHGPAKVTHRAHRMAYQLLVGEIPPGLLIDHTCHVRACVNPQHLRLATPKQNMENRSGVSSLSKSGIRGVARVESTGLWRAHVTHNRKFIFVGTFHTKEDADAAAAAKRRELFTESEDLRALCTERSQELHTK
jgi:hypothetical protein